MKLCQIAKETFNRISEKLMRKDKKRHEKKIERIRSYEEEEDETKGVNAQRKCFVFQWHAACALLRQCDVFMMMMMMFVESRKKLNYTKKIRE